MDIVKIFDKISLGFSFNCVCVLSEVKNHEDNHVCSDHNTRR